MGGRPHRFRKVWCEPIWTCSKRRKQCQPQHSDSRQGFFDLQTYKRAEHSSSCSTLHKLSKTETVQICRLIQFSRFTRDVRRLPRRRGRFLFNKQTDRISK